MQEGPNEIAVVQISRTEYIVTFYDDMLTRVHRNALYGPEINGNPIIYIGYHIRTSAVRHVIRTRGNSRWDKR